jgi:hypothetical protein
MKTYSDQLAELHKDLRDMIEYGEGEIRIKVYDNGRIVWWGGKRKTIIGYDDSDEKVCV